MPASDKILDVINESINKVNGQGAFPSTDEGMGPHVMWYLVKTGDLVPPWWSRQRDMELHRLVKESNHLSGIAYLATTKLVNIPLMFVPKDPTITAHVDQASQFSEQITLASEFGMGLRETAKKFIYDYLIFDNGGFMEVIGEGDPSGPIEGMPLSLRHLDSLNCTRTGNYEYPVVYRDSRTAKRYKIHFTRVIYMAQQPSGIQRMHGVGFSAASRSFMLGQVLQDQLVYKLEKMGSRPSEGLVVGRNIETEQLYVAYMMADELADNLGLTRYQKYVFIGGEDIDVINRDMHNFEMFDEATGTNMAIYAMFYTWGLDIRDGWPISGSKSGDQIANMKARGRLPADFTSDLKLQFDLKVCPPYLETRLDFQDDEEDQQRAIIQDIRSRRVNRLAEQGIIDHEAQRRTMLADGELSREEFIRMQYEAGKLEDGTPIEAVFYYPDELIHSLTQLANHPDPLVIEDNDPAAIVREIHVQQSRAMEILGQSNSLIQRRKATLAHAALTWLEERYQTELNRPEVNGIELEEEEQGQEEEQEDQEETEDQDEGQDSKSWFKSFLSRS